MGEPKSAREIIKGFGGLEKFKGFSRPNTTPTPDEVFDRFLTQLTHAELKVLLYIVRRTYGFRDKAGGDSVSLRQICQGITTKDGKRLDHGTDLSRRGAITAVKSLEEKGLIVVRREKSEDGYNYVNFYSLRMREGE